ncbi:MAG: BamA/TamA family outer membrane protein, partial [Calditrichia bacterium]
MQLFPLTASAQMEMNNHPELHWQSFETEHFIIHYHQGTERTAHEVANIAEEIYPGVTDLYQYWPETKTQLIIRDTDDYSNGGAYFYENKIEIWAENMDFLLRGTHNWLRDVVTHEFTHIVSIRKSLKFGPKVPAGFLQVFGYEDERRSDVVRGFPDVLVSYPIAGLTIPVWFAEGVAQFQSPSTRFDYRDSHREMILRDRVVTDHLLDLKEMSVFGKNSVGNESSYNQGYAFVNFLAETFGDSVVKDLARYASSRFMLDFNSVIGKVTGVSADSVFRMWESYLQRTYNSRLDTIREYLKTGEPLQKEGIGNIYPLYSPDGKKVAYLEGRGDYLSLNALVVKDLKSDKKQVLDGGVVSSISWSPEGRYIAYAKKSRRPSGSEYFDIFVYDLKRNESVQITEGMRATHPDWSHDGKKLAFVVHSDGLTNLFTLELPSPVTLQENKITGYYDLEKHQVRYTIPEEQRNDWQRHYRKLQYYGSNLQQLTHFTGGRQIYHPRWSPNDQYLIFDTSINFARDIAKIPADGGELTFILNTPTDERSPVFSPDGREIYFAGDRTGIFNIYSYDLQSGEVKPHTNVIGGAFMPSVSPQGDLVYSLYQDQGYKIYALKNVNELPPEHLNYRENYQAEIPRMKTPAVQNQATESSRYKRSFGPVGFMPRLLIDYGTIKPGLYVYSNEILDKMFFFGGGAINWDREYDLFSIFEYNFWKPTFFVELYNSTTEVSDEYEDPDGFSTSNDNINVRFNLLEANAGMRGRFRDYVNYELSYTYSLYRARIATFAYRELATPDIVFISPPIRYSYLKAHSISLMLKRKKVLPEVDSEINPRAGYYASFRATREWNHFLDDFATNRVVGLEVYKKYYFMRYGLDLETYIPVPATRRHSLSMRLQGGYIDHSVDDFFHNFAGGLVGLKGYSYYSISGRSLAIGTLTYRMPLVRNLNF